MRVVNVVEDHIEIVLTGLAKAGALQGRIEIPYANIARVDDHLVVPHHMLRLGGTSLGPIQEGHFESAGLWYFLSFEHPDRVVTIQLKDFRLGRHPYQAVAVGAENPAGLKAEIDVHLHHT